MNIPTLQPPQCDPNTWCRQVFNVTHNEWLAASADWLIARPLRILLILVLALLIRAMARRVIDRVVSGSSAKLSTERRQQRAKTIGSVLRSVVSFLVYGLAFIMILGELGVNLGPIIASAGIVGVALGFGAQNLVKDFLSGIFMVLEDQYGVGDVVNVGEASGTVEAVGLRVTTLRDVHGTVWYVRNGEILRVGNSSQGFAVAVVDVPVAHGSDVTRATELMASVAAEMVGTEPFDADVIEPPKVLGVETVTNEGLTLRTTVKVRPGRQWAVQRELRARVVAAFEEDGIRPPLGRLTAPPPA